MKLSNRQRQFLKGAKKMLQGHGMCYVRPGTSSARRTVEGLIRRGLVEWVNDEHYPDETQYTITAAGVDAYNATIPVPEITPRDFLRMDDKGLREFVRHYCDGKIFSNVMAHADDASRAFVPIMFGGLSLPEGLVPPFEEEEPDKPEAPTKPEKIPKPQAAKEPWRPFRIAEIQAEIQEIQNRQSWGMADSDEHRPLIQERDQLEAEYQTALMEYKEGQGVHAEALVAWKAEKAAQAKAFKEVQRAHKQEMKAYYVALGDYTLRKEAHQEIRGRASELYFANLGLIYEYYSEAGPRSINGLPMFMSCRIMHREDWDRARKAIKAEMKRREEIEI